MMRRMFWIIVGALLGVTGYRRVSRLARAVTPGGRRDRREVPRTQDWARGAALFARDVREGMELYTDRHPKLAGRTLEGQHARAPRPGDVTPDRAYPGIDYAKEGR
jgi:hypothetical protein